MKRNQTLSILNKALFVICLLAIITGVASSIFALWGIIENKELATRLIVSSVVFFLGAVGGSAAIGCFKSNQYAWTPEEDIEDLKPKEEPET